MSFQIDHIAFIVPELEEAIERWTRVLGYEFAPITRYRTDHYIDRDNPEPHLHDARKTISRQGLPRIELLEATGTGTHSAQFAGPHHLGVRGISNPEALLEELRTRGVDDDGRSIGPNGELLLFFTAPEALDGMRIEFVSTIPGPVVSDDGRPLPIDPDTGRPDVWAAPL